MKYFLIILTIKITNICVFAQSSFLFKETLPVEVKENSFFDEEYFGKYQGDKQEVYYEINKEGICTVSTMYTFISKEQVRETSRYKVKGDYLFGVVNNDSVLCHFEDDKYYFKIEIKKYLSKEEVSIKKWKKNKFIVNFIEDGGFSPSIFEFSNKQLIVQHFNYSENEKFSFINNKETITKEGSLTIYLNPTKQESKIILDKNYFDKSLVYNRL
ncbi:MAG: hypothetical protein HYU67_02985 [Flavobacteriia bacterium]|nr:hypothetical protein [Flavobacteriia bacterium]